MLTFFGLRMRVDGVDPVDIFGRFGRLDVQMPCQGPHYLHVSLIRPVAIESGGFQKMLVADFSVKHLYLKLGVC